MDQVEVFVESVLKDLAELIERFGVNFEDVHKVLAIFGVEFGINGGGVNVISKDECGFVFLKESFEEIDFFGVVFEYGR